MVKTLDFRVNDAFLVYEIFSKHNQDCLSFEHVLVSNLNADLPEIVGKGSCGKKTPGSLMLVEKACSDTI